MLNRIQCRAARAILEWSQADLAARSNLSAGTIRDFETGRRTPTRANLVAMRRALEEGGVLILNDTSPGARLLPKNGAPIALPDAPDESRAKRSARAVRNSTGRDSERKRQA
jgi:transcriptional regulator with XRE-family HTH domain